MIAGRAAGAALLLALSWPAAAEAWNPLGALRVEAGRFVDAASTPTIQNVETAGLRLLEDLDLRIGKQLGAAGSLATVLVSDVDRVAAARIDQLNLTLEARLLQVSTSADGLVRGALGQLDDISRRRIAQAGGVAESLVLQVDATVQKAILRADEVLRQRQAEMGAMVTDAVRQTDTVVAQRIEQVDEMVGRRIGNVDVTVTKQSASLEQTLLRLAVLIGLVAFIGFVLWRLWDDLGEMAPQLAKLHDHRWAQAGLAARTLGTRLLVRVAAAGVAVLVLWALYDRLPRGPSRRLDQLVEQQRGALEASLARLELTPVRQYASQLEILDPPRGHVYRAQVAKVMLMRDVLARPTLLRTPEGVAQLTAALQQAELQSGADPDVLVMKAFVLWQVGHLRSQEKEAATLCAQALRAAPGGFTLAPLARHYLRAYLHQPHQPLGADDPSAGDRAAWAGLLSGDVDFAPIRHLVTYDRLVRELDRSSTAGYVSMVEAHGDYLRSRANVGAGEPGQGAIEEARRRRTEAARRVVSAWQAFDQALREAPELAASPVVLSVFMLNDAVLTRALWFADNPEATEAAPALAAALPVIGARRGGAGRSVGEPAASRLRRAPMRLAWRARYAGLLGTHARSLVDAQEADRFRELERDTLAFERAAIRRRLSSDVSGGGSGLSVPARDLALAAARLGFYVDGPNGTRVSLARALLGVKAEPSTPSSPTITPTLEEIAQANDQRRLRLL